MNLFINECARKILVRTCNRNSICKDIFSLKTYPAEHLEPNSDLVDRALASCCQDADVCSSCISTERALQRYINFLKLTSILQVFFENREKKFENPS